MNYYAYEFDIGKLYISEENGIIIAISPLDYHGSKKESQAIKNCAQELQEYFKGQRKVFSFKYQHRGTPFQEKVWKALETIPFGQTVHYQDIAKMIDNPKASQAVGGACKRNELLIVVPCHRIVAKGKSGGGFRMGVDVKSKLLELEAKSY